MFIRNKEIFVNEWTSSITLTPSTVPFSGADIEFRLSTIGRPEISSAGHQLPEGKQHVRPTRWARNRGLCRCPSGGGGEE